MGPGWGNFGPAINPEHACQLSIVLAYSAQQYCLGALPTPPSQSVPPHNGYVLITRATICWPYLAHKTSSLFAKGRSVACLDTPVRLEQQWQGVRNRNTRCTKAKKHKGTLMSIALRMQLDELPTVCWHLLCNLKQWKLICQSTLAPHESPLHVPFTPKRTPPPPSNLPQSLETSPLQRLRAAPCASFGRS